MHRSTTNGPNKSQVPKSQRETNLNMLTHASDPDKAPKSTREVLVMSRTYHLLVHLVRLVILCI